MCYFWLPSIPDPEQVGPGSNHDGLGRLGTEKEHPRGVPMLGNVERPTRPDALTMTPFVEATLIAEQLDRASQTRRCRRQSRAAFVTEGGRYWVRTSDLFGVNVPICRACGALW
jgi:hypothetical protein